MRTWLREHGLLLVNAGLFVAFLLGMTFTGWNVANNEALRHGESPDSLGAYVVLTVFLFQKGSSESKPLDGSAPQDEDPRDHAKDPGAPWPVRRGGLALVLYENSLLIGASVYLRQRGSSESKPVHAPHSETGG